MDDSAQVQPQQDSSAQPLLASPEVAPQQQPATQNPDGSYINQLPQDQVKSDVSEEVVQKQQNGYHDQLAKLQKAGFSANEIENWSINQAVK